MVSASEARRVIVHFGMPKTGSTSIQASFFRHLSDSRFYYTGLGGPNANNGVATAFKSNPARFHLHARSGTSSSELQHLRKETVERLNADLRTAAERTAILSAESVSGLKETEFRELCSALSQGRRRAAAVGYVRRPKEYVESTFQQNVKAGLREFNVPRMFPNYRFRFEKFDAVLGRENAHIWLFDPVSFPGKCVVQDLCARLGITFRPEDVIRANEGLSVPALSLLYAYRKFGPGYGVGPTVIQENRRLARYVMALPGPKLRLHSSLIEPLIARRRKDIDWMERRLGASLAEDLTAHDEIAIRSEEDLLRIAPAATQWLAGELGDEYVRHWRPDISPREVAEWMHRLRVRLSAEGETPQRIVVAVSSAAPVSTRQVDKGGREMDIEQLVQSAKQSVPKLKLLEDKDAQTLLREVFRQIRQEIEVTSEGVVKVDALGQFRVRPGEREKDGQRIPVKRVAFQPARMRDEARAGRRQGG